MRGQIINARPGPVVTLYELEPAPGIKSSRVIGLADDIARSMSALSARVAVVSGRNAIGIELPNDKREKVYFREMLASDEYTETQAKLPLCLGKTIGGEPVMVDLARMPHLLIAGTTGSGKSVAINTMILSLLYRLTPDQCRLIMVDPKMLELSVYDGIPHLLTPVVTDPRKAVVALKWAVREMEERYKKMSKLGVRNIDGYNMRVAEAKAKGETITRTVHTGYDKESGEAIYEKEELELEPLPYIVVIVDEMADLMMVAGKDIEGAVQRLAQMARAAGIHVILATQRPSVDVITGTIKANFPTRISFQVTSKIDSRTILGEQGAEQLLGQGDMLYMAGGGRISRVHGPFCSDEEVEKVVRHLKSQGQPQYLEAVTTEDEAELDEDGNPVFDATSHGRDRRRHRPLPAGRPDRAHATKKPPPATSSGGCKSATIAPPPSWNGWSRRASSARPTTRENAKSWLARKSTRSIENAGSATIGRGPPRAAKSPQPANSGRPGHQGSGGARHGQPHAEPEGRTCGTAVGPCAGRRIRTIAPPHAQSVPLPVPAPQPKSYDRPAAQAPRPPQQIAPAPSSNRTAPPQQQQSGGFPSIFPKPPNLFGGSGQTTAFDARQRALADRVSGYLSGVRQLQGKFVQVGPDGGKSEGEFFLQKPGKVRFDYNPPSPIELIADGQSVVVRDRKLATQDLYPLSQTPLRFLLADRIDLMRDTNLVGVYADDVFVTVVIEERQIIAGTHRVMLMFGAQDYQLRQWTVTDPQGFDTTVAVYNLDTRVQPDPNLFRIDYTRIIQ